jgi:hypothetical protein
MKNKIAYLCLTAKASFHNAIEEYREVIGTYMTKDLEHAIQLSMKPGDCHRMCQACARAGRSCCVIILPSGDCQAGCCQYA